MSTHGKSSDDCIIENSLYGINLFDSLTVLGLDSLSFFQNDNGIILNEIILFSNDTTYYSFAEKEEIVEKPVEKPVIPVEPEKPLKKKIRKKGSPTLNVLQYTFLTCAVTGFICMFPALNKADHYHNKYEKIWYQ